MCHVIFFMELAMTKLEWQLLMLVSLHMLQFADESDDDTTLVWPRNSGE